MNLPSTAVPFSVPTVDDSHFHDLHSIGFMFDYGFTDDYEETGWAPHLMPTEDDLTPFDTGSIPGSTKWSRKHLEGISCKYCCAEVQTEWVDFYGGYQTFCPDCGTTGPVDTDAKACVNKFKAVFG